jgi:putative tricarboxylic transport membrane protein|tara:strand:- start:111884 stop:113401 length:1518 start_codon:yes stop_codon:yes gene_type:complete
MDFFANLALGAHVAFQPEALLFCFVGVTLGTLIGALPGIGPLAAISVALPLTFGMDSSVALIMLAGIFYGAQYGGSITSILLNLPGTPSTAITALDGYPMAQRGEAGLALFINAFASFCGSSFSILLLMFFAPMIASLALTFHSTEYFAIMLLGLIAASTLAGGSPVKSLLMVCFGLILGMVGIDLNSGTERLTFGILELTDGVSLIAVAMGMFGVAEVLTKMELGSGGSTEKPNPIKLRLRDMLPSLKVFRKLAFPILRGASLGSIVGALPGAGPTIAAFMAYSFEKQVNPDRAAFGTGEPAGVAAPEAANNAAVQTAFIPTLGLGIPGDVVMAVLLAAMMMHGVVPGPRFIPDQPAIFWGLIVSFWVGNLMLLVLNLPLIGLFVRLLQVPTTVLLPVIVFFICMGSYSVSNNPFDIYVTLIFGIVGYVLAKVGFEPAPVLLGFVLGPMVEENFRRTMTIARGDLSVFAERPIALSLLVIAAAIVIVPLLRAGLKQFGRKSRRV